MDRKAWIVIILCCLGLAVNLHFGRKNRESLAEQERKRQAEQVTKDLVGKSVRMTVIAAGHPMKVTGQLRFVSPETDPVTKQVRVWAEVPNEDGRLRPGQQGTLEIFR